MTDNAINTTAPFADNAKRDAIVGFINSDRNVYNAMQARFEAAKVLLDLGMTSGFIQVHRASVKGIYGAEFLNADESVIYQKDLEERKKTSKQEKEQYARLDNLINNRIKALCETLESIEMEAAAKNKSASDVAKEKIEKAKAKGTKSDSVKTAPAELCANDMQNCYNRVKKGADKEVPEFTQEQLREVTIALTRACEVLGKKLKTN